MLIENNHIYCQQYQTKMLWSRAQLFFTDPRINIDLKAETSHMFKSTYEAI